MRALFNITTPAFWVVVAALLVLAQLPNWRAFYQTNKPYTDISIVMLTALTLRSKNQS